MQRSMKLPLTVAATVVYASRYNSTLDDVTGVNSLKLNKRVFDAGYGTASAVTRTATAPEPAAAPVSTRANVGENNLGSQKIFFDPMDKPIVTYHNGGVNVDDLFNSIDVSRKEMGNKALKAQEHRDSMIADGSVSIEYFRNPETAQHSEKVTLSVSFANPNVEHRDLIITADSFDGLLTKSDSNIEKAVIQMFRSLLDNKLFDYENEKAKHDKKMIELARERDADADALDDKRVLTFYFQANILTRQGRQEYFEERKKLDPLAKETDLSPLQFLKSNTQKFWNMSKTSWRDTIQESIFSRELELAAESGSSGKHEDTSIAIDEEVFALTETLHQDKLLTPLSDRTKVEICQDNGICNEDEYSAARNELERTHKDYNHRLRYASFVQLIYRHVGRVATPVIVKTKSSADYYLKLLPYQVTDPNVRATTFNNHESKHMLVVEPKKGTELIQIHFSEPHWKKVVKPDQD